MVTYFRSFLSPATWASLYTIWHTEIEINDEAAYSDAYLNDELLNENDADDSLFKDDMFEGFDDFENLHEPVTFDWLLPLKCLRHWEAKV